MNRSIFIIIIWILFSKPAFAYLDPGTFSIIGAFIASVAVSIAAFYYRLKVAIKKIISYLSFNKKNKKL